MLDQKKCNVCSRVYREERDFLKGTTRWRVCSEGNLWFNCACSSTLMLKKGKFPWYSPELALAPEALGVFNRLGNLKDLPHIPSQALKIQEMLQDADTSPKEVAREVRKEPVLAAQVLQIAENIRKTRNPTTPPIHALEHAIVYIGFKALGDLIVTSALRQIPLPKSGFNADDYWRESYLTGSIAEQIMRRFAPTLNPDEVFLAGSLCNLGKLVLAFCFPPLVTKLADDVSEKAKTLVDWSKAEKAYGFPDHGILGEIASAIWGLPIQILESTRKHHLAPDSNLGAKFTTWEIVAMANQMLHWILLRPHRMDESIVQAFAVRAGLDEASLDKLAKDITSLKNQIRLDPE